MPAPSKENCEAKSGTEHQHHTRFSKADSCGLNRESLQSLAMIPIGELATDRVRGLRLACCAPAWKRLLSAAIAALGFVYFLPADLGASNRLFRVSFTQLRSGGTERPASSHVP